MDLTDTEVETLHSLLFEETLYGDRSKWSEAEFSDMSSVLEKVVDVAKQRKFWWAR